MVAEIKSNGRLKLTNLGGMNPNNAETENVRVVTKFSGIYEGTFQLCNASVHVNGEYNNTKRSWDTCEVVPDEDVRTKEDTEKLGIAVGDIVCFETTVSGLDCSHMGFIAVNKDGSVGVIHASSKAKEVVEMTSLKDYTRKLPKCIGIRVLRLNR